MKTMKAANGRPRAAGRAKFKAAVFLANIWLSDLQQPVKSGVFSREFPGGFVLLCPVESGHNRQKASRTTATAGQELTPTCCTFSPKFSFIFFQKYRTPKPSLSDEILVSRPPKHPAPVHPSAGDTLPHIAMRPPRDWGGHCALWRKVTVSAGGRGGGADASTG